MKDMAIARLDKELKELKPADQKIKAMKQAVHDALVEFCAQDGEFAQAVVQGGTFTDCMAAVVKDVGTSISDLEAYRRAVQFYFPGADIKMQMSIDLCPQAVEPEAPTVPDKGGIVLDFKSLFF